MEELYYKILFGSLVITMNWIRIYFRNRYKVSHAEKVKEVKPAKEKMLVALMTVCLAIPGLLWLFSDLLDFGQFALNPIFRIAGFIIGVYSMWLFWKVHQILGDNWSPVLEIRKEHTMIVSGPYRLVRHPMYSSMILWGVSFSLLTSNWCYALIYFFGLTLLLSFRLKDEEQLMASQFGRNYQIYKEKTKRLIPYIF